MHIKKPSQVIRADFELEQAGKQPVYEQLFEDVLCSILEDATALFKKQFAKVTQKQWANALQQDYDITCAYYSTSYAELDALLDVPNHVSLIDACSMCLQHAEFQKLNDAVMKERARLYDLSQDDACDEDINHAAACRVYKEIPSIQQAEQARFQWLVSHRVLVTAQLDKIVQLIKQ